MEYDAQVIVEFAKKLYAKANSIITTYTIFGVLLGALIGAGATRSPIGALIFAAVIGVFAYALGVDKAFQLKLQAQIALCQVQIEKNTRSPS